MDFPLISCLCPTYNRPPSHQHLIEEAIESFLRQDYPHRELVILNDTPGQELKCDAPGVRIVNVAGRFATLGEKCNALVRLAEGELIAPWDDDDISLPWRLSLSFERLGSGEYMNPRDFLVLDHSGLSYGHRGYAHNASLFRRELFERVGGYRSISMGYDRDIDAEFRAAATSAYDPQYRGSPPLAPEEQFYIYRWGVSPQHVSSGALTDDGRYGEIGEQPVVDGCYWLEPAWGRDYLEMVASAQPAVG